MYCNTSATLYSYQSEGVYTRQVLDGVFWEENGVAIFRKTGLISSIKAFIMIPYAEGLAITKEKDRIVRGTIEYEVTTEHPITELMKTYDARLITEVDLKKSGSVSMWHWEVGGK